MKLLLALLIVALSGCAASVATESRSENKISARLQGQQDAQWIIGLKSMPDNPEAFTRTLADYAKLPLVFVRTGSNNMLIVRIGEGGDPTRMSQLTTHPQVRYAEPDQIVTLSPPKRGEHRRDE